jgi:hypothetical protein
MLDFSMHSSMCIYSRAGKVRISLVWFWFAWPSVSIFLIVTGISSPVACAQTELSMEYPRLHIMLNETGFSVSFASFKF